MGELLPSVTSFTSVRELHRHQDSGFKRYSSVPGLKGLNPVSSDDSVLITSSFWKSQDMCTLCVLLQHACSEKSESVFKCRRQR